MTGRLARSKPASISSNAGACSISLTSCRRGLWQGTIGPASAAASGCPLPRPASCARASRRTRRAPSRGRRGRGNRNLGLGFGLRDRLWLHDGFRLGDRVTLPRRSLQAPRTLPRRFGSLEAKIGLNASTGRLPRRRGRRRLFFNRLGPAGSLAALVSRARRPVPRALGLFVLLSGCAFLVRPFDVGSDLLGEHFRVAAIERRVVRRFRRNADSTPFFGCGFGVANVGIVSIWTWAAVAITRSAAASAASSEGKAGQEPGSGRGRCCRSTRGRAPWCPPG